MTNVIKSASLAIIPLFMIPLLPAQEPSPAPEVFKDSILEFRYAPPANMHDFTSLDRESIQERSTVPATKLTLLLSLRSGEDITAVNWRSVKIVTYPSDKFGNLRDSTASQEAFSQRAAGAGKETRPPSRFTVGDFHFLVFTFELSRDRRTKYSRVYTTVCDGRMLSFVFSASSPGILNNIVASMKTFEPLEFK